jgi:hypothetical protein
MNTTVLYRSSTISRAHVLDWLNAFSRDSSPEEIEPMLERMVRYANATLEAYGLTWCPNTSDVIGPITFGKDADEVGEIVTQAIDNAYEDLVSEASQ